MPQLCQAGLVKYGRGKTRAVYIHAKSRENYSTCSKNHATHVSVPDCWLSDYSIYFVAIIALLIIPSIFLCLNQESRNVTDRISLLIYALFNWTFVKRK